jgi:hypothetical protein
MKTIGTFTPDNLYADIGFPEIRETRAVPAGTAVKRGDILGDDFEPIAAGGTVDSIALEDVAADAAVRICTVALTGAFNASALSTGDATTPDDWKDDLRRLSIFVRHPAP